MKMVPEVKLKSGNKIPKLGLGTWLIGGTRERDPNNDDESQIKGIRCAIDHGIKFIRTAQNYAEGYCEEIIARAIEPYEREDLFITSCVNEHSAATSKTLLIQNGLESLKRLKMDYFNLYLIGGVNQNVSIRDIAEGLMYLLEKGYTKDIGVSNYRLKE